VKPELLIDGELRGASDGSAFEIVDPATELVIGHAPDASDADVDEAIAVARRAFDQTSWPADREFRARCLRQLKSALDEDFAALQEITVAEAGVPVVWTDGPQLRIPIDGLDYVASLLESYQWEHDLGLAKPMGIATQRRVYREPAGVVAAITPWNFPNQITLAKLGPALAAGCTVVLKPAQDTPWTGAELGRLIAEQTEIPPGVVNVVTSSRAAAGRAHRVQRVHTRGPGLRADHQADRSPGPGTTRRSKAWPPRCARSRSAIPAIRAPSAAR